MNQLNKIQERQKDTAMRAGEVMAFGAKSQFANGVFIQNEEERRTSIQEAAKGVALFEGAPEAFVNQVSVAWGQSIAEYANKHGRYPSEDMLANAHRQVETMLAESAKEKHTGFHSAMFEAANGDMRDSQGVMRQALFAALILPVALGATTGDMVTFVPCERDETKIYKIEQIAGSTFGHYNKGDVLDMQSAGEYSQFQHSRWVQSADLTGAAASTGDTSLYVQKLETVAAGASAATAPTSGHEWPIRPGRCLLVVNGIRSRNYDDGGDGKTGILTFEGDGTTFTNSIAVKIDYEKGSFTFDEANWKKVKADSKIGLVYELDVEMKADLIPLINQKMKSFLVKPSQYAIATEYTIQALTDAQREFGLDLHSQLFNGARNFLSHETDMKRIREALFRNVNNASYDVTLAATQNLDNWIVGFRRILHAESVAMVNRTKAGGIRGGFAGVNVVNLLKALPAAVWTPAPGYVESPYIQLAGTLFGVYRIYEVPSRVTDQFKKQQLGLTADSIFFYGRGDNIGDAGMIAGDAIPALPFVHPTNPNLVNRTTLWGVAINQVHPDDGQDYFAMLELKNIASIGGASTGVVNP